MMNYELEYLLKTNSNSEGCGDQQSLGDLLADLRAVADGLELDFICATSQAEPVHRTRYLAEFDPCI